MINPALVATRGLRQLRTVQSDAGVPALRQLQQMVTLRRACGLSRAEYFKYQLWRPELSEVERLTYTSQRERRLTEIATNHREARTGRTTKSTTLSRLAASGLPVPELIGRIGARVPSDHDELPAATTLRELASVLGDAAAAAVVFKPEFGMQGTDIMVAVEVSANSITLLSGARLTIAELWKRLDRPRGRAWRIERWLRPHAALAEFRPGATPTVRVLTLRVDGGVVVHAASVKLPRGSSGVDNLAQGNLAAPVDLDTGVVGPATDGAGTARFDRHPESGQPITGLVVPDWEAVRALTVAAMPTFARLRAIGWDVAVTDRGPVIVEPNSSWCEKLIQLPMGRGLTRGPFIRLLKEVDAFGLLARRRACSSAWVAFEEHALHGRAER